MRTILEPRGMGEDWRKGGRSLRSDAPPRLHYYMFTFRILAPSPSYYYYFPAQKISSVKKKSLLKNILSFSAFDHLISTTIQSLTD